MVNSKKTWVCEECGREFSAIPFPASCKCGNWCEDFFREKDIYDLEDDSRGVPLLGVKYAPEVLKERSERLKKEAPIVQSIEKEESIPTISFDTMSKVQLRRYLKEVGSPYSTVQAKQEELVKACKRWEEVNNVW
jgi:hypothetical protein